MEKIKVAKSKTQLGRPFAHIPLGDNLKTIRVLQIEQGDRRNPLQCTLKHISLEYAPKYVCLSYMWGEPIASHSILINGHPFSIRQSLFEFLHIARKPSICKSLLWIDAICINQDDLEERNAQVRIMSDIYRSAESIIIYPGPFRDPAKIKVAFGLWYLRVCSARNIPHIMHWRLRQLCLNPAQHYMEEFMALPYWNRMWIVQEVLLSRTAHVLCYNKLLELSCFEALWPSQTHIPRLPEVRDLDLRRFVYGDFKKFIKADIYALLNIHGDRQCQLINDRIYALLGLCDAPSSFPIDRHRSPALVVLDVLEHFSFGNWRAQYSWPHLWNFARETSSAPRGLGVYPYLLCYSCFVRVRSDTSQNTPEHKNTDRAPRCCRCPEYPLRFVYTLKSPVREGYEDRFDYQDVRRIDEEGGSFFCEGCDILLHECRVEASMTRERLSDSELLFEVRHPPSSQGYRDLEEYQ